jgi:hypothetical protein
MNLVNATRMVAGYTLGLDRHARESLVVVVKGTYLIPERALDIPKLAPEQVPLVTADEFTGEPGFSAPLIETDFAPIKPRCDVLLNGSAYAPGGKPVDRVTVSLRVGNLKKSFDVVGRRTWTSGLLGLTPGPAEKFTVQPISYNVAFGGADPTVADPAKQKIYLANPVGIGYHDHFNTATVVGQPLPHTEESGTPVVNPRGKYRPMALGPLGRSWPDRVRFAGTYDQKWLDDVSPFLPEDFQEEYFQAAPQDQQMAFPAGNEEVELVNLTPSGRTLLKLPQCDVPIEFAVRGTEPQMVSGVLDTLILEPDLARFQMVWRASYALRRNLFEVEEIVVGKMPPGWYRARVLGKQYYRSLREWTAAQEARR